MAEFESLQLPNEGLSPELLPALLLRGQSTAVGTEAKDVEVANISLLNLVSFLV